MFAVAAKAFEESPDDPSAEQLAGLQDSVNRLEGIFSTLEDAHASRSK